MRDKYPNTQLPAKVAGFFRDFSTAKTGELPSQLSIWIFIPNKSDLYKKVLFNAKNNLLFSEL